MKTGTSCGKLSGHIRGTDSHIKVKTVTVDLDYDTAWALCNLLHDFNLESSPNLETSQKTPLINLGSAIGRIIGHGTQNNTIK